MAAGEIIAGRSGRALGHATSGPALQQNLVCVMEARGWHQRHETAGRRARGRPDPAPFPAGGCVHRRAVPGSGGPGRRGRGAHPGRHRRGGGRQGARPVRGRDDARAVPGRRARRGGQAAAPGAHGRARSAARPGSSLPAWSRLACTAGYSRWRSRSSPNPTPCGRCPSPPRSACRCWPARAATSRRTSAAYIRRSGAPGHIGAMVAVKDRRNGARNPYAHLQQADITLEKVQASPMLWDPVRYDETCPSSDGACAVVIGDAAVARDRDGRGSPGGLDPGHLDAHRADHVLRQGPRQPAGGRGRRGRAVAAGRASPTRPGRSTRPRSTCRSPGSSRCGWRTSASPSPGRAGG